MRQSLRIKLLLLIGWSNHRNYLLDLKCFVGINSIGDWLQLLAASSWFLPNISSLKILGKIYLAGKEKLK